MNPEFKKQIQKKDNFSGKMFTYFFISLGLILLGFVPYLDFLVAIGLLGAVVTLPIALLSGRSLTEDIAYKTADAIGKNMSDMRECPYCKENIKKNAVICRYCNKDVQPVKDKDYFANQLSAQNFQ